MSETTQKKRKKREEKEFDAKHELEISSSEKQLNGLLLKKVEFLDVPYCFKDKKPRWHAPLRRIRMF